MQIHPYCWSAATLVMVAVVAGSTPAWSSDGILEINQACAVNTGCFPGDDPLFPVTITSSGSYQLTSNLTTTEVNTGMIEITAVDVTLDLGGFVIAGIVQCIGTPATCDTTGTGFGINAASNTYTIRNGTVRGIGGYGVRAMRGGSIDGIHAVGNATFGFLTSGDTTIRHSHATQNGVHGFFHTTGGIATFTGNVARGNAAVGIWLDTGTIENSISQSNASGGINCPGSCTVRGNQSEQNGFSGITIGTGGVVSGNTVHTNTANGIEAGPAVTISDNSVEANGGDGIVCGNGCTIRGNSIRSNADRGIVASFASQISDNSVYANGSGEATDDGIEAADGSLVQNNAVRSNDGIGIELTGSQSGYRANVVSNNGGVEVSGGVDMGGNLIDGAL